ncbi:MAG: DUF2017 family protein [Actinomycetaceae bacterium]|nr:DUF2017 family protein [Actinomycetaceae bacterium]
MLLRSFQATSRGFVTELDDEVALILQQLLGETITVLDAPSEQSFLSAITVDERRDEPDDPTLRILLPSMSADPEEAQTLRAMTEDTLRTEKSERLIAIRTALADIITGASNTIVVPAEHVWAWLSGLNDLRLVLAQRLGVESSDETEIWYQRVNAIFDGEGASAGSSSGEGASAGSGFDDFGFEGEGASSGSSSGGGVYVGSSSGEGASSGSSSGGGASTGSGFDDFGFEGEGAPAGSSSGEGASAGSSSGEGASPEGAANGSPSENPVDPRLTAGAPPARARESQHALPHNGETGTPHALDHDGETGPRHALLHEKNAEGGADNNPLVLTHEELVALVFVLVSWWQDSLLEAVQSQGSQSTL